MDEEHEVLVIEKSNRVCKLINEEMGNICVRGDGCEATTLDEIGTGRADMFMAVTGDDEDNLVACQVAKYKFKVPRTIARIRNPQNESLFKKLGVDVTVSSTNIILEHIEQEVPTHPLTHLLSLEDKGLEIVEIKITPELPTIGKSVRELPLPRGSKLALVIRKEGKNRVPTKNTILRAEDLVIALTPPELEDELRKALRGA